MMNATRGTILFMRHPLVAPDRSFRIGARTGRVILSIGRLTLGRFDR